MKRVILFVITNLLIVLTISTILSVLGVGQYMTAQGINYKELAIFCFIWGMTGSLISLALSRIMAKWMMGVETVTRNTPQFTWLVTMVEDLSRKAGLPVVPEIGVYHSPEVNAFATGPSKRRALVAFSTGLLQSMDRQEIEGVAAHELAHIKNGDMVTMTLLQGVINAFVMFFARVIAWGVAQQVREESRATVQFLVVFVLQIVLGMLGMMVVCAFSRWREFRADRGAAQYAGRNAMIAALQRLAGNTRQYDSAPALAALKISGGAASLFSTHPPLAKRIEALMQSK